MTRSCQGRLQGRALGARLPRQAQGRAHGAKLPRQVQGRALGAKLPREAQGRALGAKLPRQVQGRALGAKLPRPAPHAQLSERKRALREGRAATLLLQQPPYPFTRSTEACLRDERLREEPQKQKACPATEGYSTV